MMLSAVGNILNISGIRIYERIKFLLTFGILETRNSDLGQTDLALTQNR